VQQKCTGCHPAALVVGRKQQPVSFHSLACFAAGLTMMGFKKYIGLSTLLACGVGYHAFSTREQCALLRALPCCVPFPLTCVLDVRCAVCVVMRKGTFLSSLATGSCCCTKAVL